MRRGGICDRNPKKCRFSREHSCASYTNVLFFFFHLHKLYFVKFYLLMTIYNAESWIRSDGRRNKKWFPRDAGLLEESTGMGLSLSLLVAAVCLSIAINQTLTLNLQKPGFVNSHFSLSFPSQFYYFTINLLHHYNFLFFFFFFRMTCHFLQCLVFYGVKMKKDECNL